MNWPSLVMGNNRVKYIMHKMKIEEKGDQKISSKNSSVGANAGLTLNCGFCFVCVLARKSHDYILFRPYHLHENSEAVLNDSNLLFL